MLAQTVARLGATVPVENVWVITNREQRASVLAACPELLPAQVVGEPVGRDTAAAVALAAWLVGRKNPAATLALLPADAVIHDAAGFQKVLAAAFAAAESAPVLATIGITPTAPATGYGYIHKGASVPSANGWPVFAAQRFVEKPDAATAQKYLDSGEYFWNAGMFVWTVAAIRQAFERHEPEVWRGVQALDARLAAGETLDAALDAAYPPIKKISVDYAILEKADNVVCLPSDFDWDDVGEWPAVARHEKADSAGNVRRGEVAVLDAKNNILFAEDGHTLAVLGVEDLIIVHTPDATLVCPKSRAQDIKKLVQQLDARLT
jgi:mannose-1-phosphate guanylyltransferase